jgi:glutamate racemase
MNLTPKNYPKKKKIKQLVVACCTASANFFMCVTASAAV